MAARLTNLRSGAGAETARRAAAAQARIAAAERWTSSLLVNQLENEIRIAGPPFQTVPPSQQVPSCWTRAVAVDYLARVALRHVGPRSGREELIRLLGAELPANGDDPARIIDALAAAADSGTIEQTGFQETLRMHEDLRCVLARNVMLEYVHDK